MEMTRHRMFFLLLFITVLDASCSAVSRMGGTSKKFGCGVHKGFVGY
jgi:hypothetical protein